MTSEITEGEIIDQEDEQESEATHSARNDDGGPEADMTYEEHQRKKRKPRKPKADSAGQYRRNAKKNRSRAIHFGFHGYDGTKFCRKDNPHMLHDITKANECGPIEQRFWQEPAFRVRNLGTNPP